jgi:DNA polymerase-1
MLLKAFREDKDVHGATAAEVFGIMPEMVTKDMRRVAKIVNFGIIYGLSAFGLSRDLKISRSEADKYIKTYFERYGGVRRYLDESLEKAREHGYVTTLTGRKRVIADINSKNRVVRQSAERMAINTPVQGSAADMIKLAMIRIHEKLKANRMKSRMILQVHDELLFEVPPDEEDRLADMVRSEMENVLELKVPVKVDIGIGETWGH